MLHIADPERNAHAQKTKRGDEESNSDAEKEVGWSESRKKEGAGHRQKSTSHERAADCRRRSSAEDVITCK